MSKQEHSLSCFHCGLLVPDASDWTVLIDGQSEPMCCPGCQAVAGAIVSGGLENYYQLRTEVAPKADEEKEQSPFVIYDDEELQAQFVSGESSLLKVRLLIDDIHCAACCWLIEESLKQCEGIESIQVNLSTHKAVLCWDKNKIKLSDIMARIHRVGYSVQIYQPDQQQVLLDKNHKQHLMRLGVASIVMMQAMMLSFALYGGDFSGMNSLYRQYLHVFGLMMILPVIGYSALPFFQGAWRSLKSKHLGMDVPVSIALVSAFIASGYTVWQGEGEVYFDSISMFVFLLLLARFIELRVRRHLFSSQAGGLLPPSCWCWDIDTKQYLMKAAYKVDIGEHVLIKVGETIGFDGRVIEGSSFINESAFSGEQKAIFKQTSDEVYAGTINSDGVLVVEVSCRHGDSRLDQINQLAEESEQSKPTVVLLADSIARYFTAFVLVLAAVTALYWYQQGSLHTFAIVLSVLVVSCPCALSLATPAALSFCVLALRAKGLLVCNSRILEKLKTIDTVIFDKTGTLTDGALSLHHVEVVGSVEKDKEKDTEKVKQIAAALEVFSEHPIAAAFKNISPEYTASKVSVCSGLGIEGTVEGTAEGVLKDCRYRIGSQAFCEQGFKQKNSSLGVFETLPMNQNESNRLLNQFVYLANSEGYLARFTLQDHLREGAQEAIDQLHALGKRVHVLSGDSSGAAEQLAKQLGIETCLSGVSPEQKLQYLREQQKCGHSVMMVGDGINDIPALAQADVSFAMNGASDLAKTKADGVLLGDSLLPLLSALSHAIKTRRIIRENVCWALLYNGLSLPFAAMGWVPPWLAAVGMSLSSLLVTFNSLRLKKAS